MGWDMEWGEPEGFKANKTTKKRKNQGEGSALKGNREGRKQKKKGGGLGQGEVWSQGADGGRYQRWWGEDHYGDGWVRRHGNSTTGEWWDQREQMDTYYNPIPHFDFRLAMGHSPTLRSLPTLPKGGEELGDGVGAL